MPNRTFIVGQVCMAASLSSGYRPRLPVGAASRGIVGSNRIATEPRRLGTLFYQGRPRVLHVGPSGVLIRPSDHVGFTR
jgi:hypothetical protein